MKEKVNIVQVRIRHKKRNNSDIFFSNLREYTYLCEFQNIQNKYPFQLKTKATRLLELVIGVEKS